MEDEIETSLRRTGRQNSTGVRLATARVRDISADEVRIAIRRDSRAAPVVSFSSWSQRANCGLVRPCNPRRLPVLQDEELPPEADMLRSTLRVRHLHVCLSTSSMLHGLAWSQRRPLGSVRQQQVVHRACSMFEVKSKGQAQRQRAASLRAQIKPTNSQRTSGDRSFLTPNCLAHKQCRHQPRDEQQAHTDS